MWAKFAHGIPPGFPDFIFLLSFCFQCSDLSEDSLISNAVHLERYSHISDYTTSEMWLYLSRCTAFEIRLSSPKTLHLKFVLSFPKNTAIMHRILGPRNFTKRQGQVSTKLYVNIAWFQMSKPCSPEHMDTLFGQIRGLIYLFFVPL